MYKRQDIDHAYWNAPEIDSMERKGFFLTADKPQTDYVAATAASLAANYLNFKDTDAEYAAKSLDYAKALFKFAQTNEKQLSDNADGPKMCIRDRINRKQYKNTVFTFISVPR